MTDWTPYTARAKDWFEDLRNRICAEFEAIEREAGSQAAFEYLPWQREEEGNDNPGGGVRGVMKGEVFDMNTRFLTTARAWFGGEADLNPPIPRAEDTEEFHAAFRAACAAHNPTYYERFSKWADDYFFIPHRGVHRGVGGIFYDHLECEGPPGEAGGGEEGDGAAWERHFAFTQDVGRAFLDVFPRIVRRRMAEPFTDADRQTQLEWRGRYAEFNLVYDRGTLFGLKTGGNIDAILMSLPPQAVWS